MMEKNDEFVDFLAQTGSILELAKMLEEDGEDAIEGIAVTVAAN